MPNVETEMYEITDVGADAMVVLSRGVIVTSSDAHKTHRTGIRSSGRGSGQTAVFNRIRSAHYYVAILRLEQSYRIFIQNNLYPSASIGSNIFKRA